MASRKIKDDRTMRCCRKIHGTSCRFILITTTRSVQPDLWNVNGDGNSVSFHWKDDPSNVSTMHEPVGVASMDGLLSFYWWNSQNHRLACSHSMFHRRQSRKVFLWSLGFNFCNNDQVVKRVVPPDPPAPSQLVQAGTQTAHGVRMKDDPTTQ